MSVEQKSTRVERVSAGRIAMREWIAADRERAREYIRTRTKVCPETSCWVWTMSLRDGYAASGGRVGGKPFSWRAHVLAYEAFIKPVPDDLELRHDCDNPRCANPAHLRTGTHADNARDMVERGRQAVGERHGSRTKPERRARGERQGSSRLTEDGVRRIFEMRAAGMTQRAIAAELGVQQPAVSKILLGKRWAHVTGIGQ